MAAPLLLIKSPMAATEVKRPFHRLGLRGESRRLARPRLQGFRRRPARQPGRRDLTRRFPKLAGAVAALEPPTLLLDGEIALFDRQLLSHFQWLRGHPKDDTATPPLLMAFDCLYARGKDLRKRAVRVPERARGDRRRSAARAPGAPAH
jgi:hypothetical protein